MKQLVTLLLVGVLVFAGYKYYSEHGGKIGGIGGLFGSAKSGQSNQAAERSRLSISSQVEKHYKALQAPLDLKNATDLTPTLTSIRQQISDRQGSAEAEKQAVYRQATVLLDGMIGLANERTKALTSLKKTMTDKAALETSKTAGQSAAFFSQGIAKRWEGDLARLKPSLDQAFVQLKSAESQWNEGVAEKASEEKYQAPAPTRI